MISLSFNKDSLHQSKGGQIFSHARLCHFHGCLCTIVSGKTTKSHSQETGPYYKTLWTLHQVCAWTREAERRNNWTPIPYKISLTSGQTMLLLCLKWNFSLEWIQTNSKNSESLQTSCYAPKSWQNGLFLRRSCISTLGPSRHAVKHRSCGATSVMRGKLYNFLNYLQNWGVKPQE